MTRRVVPDPCAVVIFGASGDLTRRKLFPALYNLQVERYLPDETSIVGTSRTPLSDDDFRADMREAVEKQSRNRPTNVSWRSFAQDVYYETGDFSDEALYKRLASRLEQVDAERRTAGNRVWYLATLPRLFAPIAEQLGKNGLLDTGGHQRLVVEKPFGRDLASARELNGTLSRFLSEDQIYRIDHYLGKETVQNLLVFRFANAIFEPIWNRRYVDHVQITVAESIGIEGRAAFYERMGALRDVGQNHLLQLLALIAMEPPIAWDADAIRDEKVKALRAVRRWPLGECPGVVARGQYDRYRHEEGVDPESTVETFSPQSSSSTRGGGPTFRST